MPPSSIKVFYFDFKGRAECIRLLLTAAGITYDDVRFSRDIWPVEYKKDAPFGQAPYIEIDGKKYGETIAILQYLAREYDLYGQSNLESLQIDQVIQLIQELVPIGGKILHEQDTDKKDEYIEDLRVKQSPRILGYIEKMLTENETGYLVGNKLSLGDLAIYDLCTCYVKDMLAPLSEYPLIEALVKKVAEDPNIKVYLESRPERPM